MNPGTVILNLAKASPDDFLAGLKSLSNQERVEVDRKMRQLEDKHQDEFSKDSGRREQTRRGFLSTLGLGAAGIGAAVASKLLPSGKVVGDQAPKAPAPVKPPPSESDAVVANLTAKQGEFANPIRRMVAQEGEYHDDDLPYVVESFPFDGGKADAARLREFVDKDRLTREEMTEFTSILNRAKKKANLFQGFNARKYRMDYGENKIGAGVHSWQADIDDGHLELGKFKQWEKREGGRVSPSRQLGSHLEDLFPLMRPGIWERAGVPIPEWMKGVQSRFDAINTKRQEMGRLPLEDQFHRGSVYSRHEFLKQDGHLAGPGKVQVSLGDELFEPVDAEVGVEQYTRDMAAALPNFAKLQTRGDYPVDTDVLNEYARALGTGIRKRKELAAALKGAGLPENPSDALDTADDELVRLLDEQEAQDKRRNGFWD